MAPRDRMRPVHPEFADKDLCFGYVIGFEAELGYFWLSELAVHGVLGLPVEQDLYFTPYRLSQVKA